jgi:hypothetical protein
MPSALFMPNKDRTDNNGANKAEQSDLSLSQVCLPQWNHRDAISENWSRGIALGEAWFDCLTNEARRQYATEHNDNRRASIRTEMQFLIADALFDERLIAIGSTDSAAAAPALTRLDAFLFRPRVCKIDWQEGYVDSLGKRFSDIHIVENSLQQAGRAPASSPIQPQPETANKRGRKSLSPLLAEAARQVATLDSLFRGRIHACLRRSGSAFLISGSTPILWRS